MFAENELNDAANVRDAALRFPDRRPRRCAACCRCDGISQRRKETLAPLLPESVSQFGAAPMLMVRLAERELRANLPRISIRQDLHRAVSLWVQVLQQNRDGKIRWLVDVDPQEA